MFNNPFDLISADDITFALGYTPENTANKGVANGYASLDSNALIPYSLIPAGAKGITVVSDIASRDAIASLDRFEGLQVLVVDASADPSVESGSASYVLRQPLSNSDWAKTGEFESLDIRKVENASGTTGIYVMPDDGRLRFKSNTYQALTLDAIQSKAELNLTHARDATINIRSTLTGWNSLVRMYRATSASDAGIELYTNDILNVFIGLDNGPSAQANMLTIKNEDSAAVSTLVCDAVNRRVGINIGTAPARELEVNGTASVSGGIYTSSVTANDIRRENGDFGLGIINSGTYQNRILVKNFDPTADNTYLEINSSNVNEIALSAKKTSDDSYQSLNFDCNNALINLKGSGINAFVINKDDGVSPRQPLQFVSIFGNDDWIFGDGANAKITWNNNTHGSSITNFNPAVTYTNDELRDKTIEIIDIIKDVFA